MRHSRRPAASAAYLVSSCLCTLSGLTRVLDLLSCAGRHAHDADLTVALPVQIGADSVGANYAIALVELASEADELEKVHQDMDALASVLSENSEVGGASGVQSFHTAVESARYDCSSAIWFFRCLRLLITSYVRFSRQVKDHFANPVVPDEDKLELLEKLSKDADFSQHTQNFLGLLVQVPSWHPVLHHATAHWFW